MSLKRLVVAAAACCAAASPSLAHASGSTTGSFGISPARRNVIANPPLALLPTHVANTTNVPYALKVFPVLLSQDLSGAFTFSEAPRDLAAGATVLTPSVTSAVLPAGTALDVKLRWNLVAVGRRAAYVGVVFQGTPQVPGKGVSVVSRLLSINLLRVPGTYHPYGVFDGMPVTQFAQQVLRFEPRVKNTGDVVEKPTHGRLVIRDSAAHKVYSDHWTGDVVLPGAEREFDVDVKQPLPAGDYTATAAMSFGANHHAKVSATFHLVGPNQLPSAALQITEYRAAAEVSTSAHVTAKIRSTGSAPASLVLVNDLYTLTSGIEGDKPIAGSTSKFDSLAPGSVTGLDTHVGSGLKAGQYRMIGRYTDPTGAPQQLISDFSTTKARGFFDRFKTWISDHAVVLVGLFALAIIGALLVTGLRRQRRLREELERLRRGQG